MKRIVTIAVVALLAIGAAFLLKSNRERINARQKTGGGVVQKISVSTARVVKQSLQRRFTFVGTLQAARELEIAAETEGKIVRLDCEAGQSKHKGQLIARIDDTSKRLAVQTAQVSVDQLKKDLERNENLHRGGAVTTQQLDAARTAYQNASIQLQKTEKELADATISTPFDGLITRKAAELGAFVRPGTPIAAIVDISRLKVKINVSESDCYALREGDTATLSTDVYPGVSFPGRISFISSKGDESHNYPVEMEIVNGRTHPLRAGTFVSVSIELPAAAPVLCVPRKALLGSTKAAQVYVVQAGRVGLRDIVIGGESDAGFEIRSGLKEGDEVVVTGQVNLSDGSVVTVAKAN
jgi:membrane fusion protein, multidrug efflux system